VGKSVAAKLYIDRKGVSGRENERENCKRGEQDLELGVGEGRDRKCWRLLLGRKSVTLEMFNFLIIITIYL
jgi:hypothetical protein